MALTLVPKPELTPKDELVLRVKRHPRPPGALQCPKCGSRTSATIRTGDIVIDGRVKPGTVNARYICAFCYKKGIEVSMLPPKIQIAEK